MQTAVENLVNNGIKYTPQGGSVTVSDVYKRQELEVVEKSDLDSREFKEKIIAALREEGNE